MGANASHQTPSHIFSADSKHSPLFDPPSSTNGTSDSLGSIFSKDKKLKRLKQKIKIKLKKGSNHSQVFADFATLLSVRDLAHIYEEYKATLYIKELFQHAESARPIASTIRNDLSEIYDFKHNSDIILVFKGVDFPVHKAIVCVRCPYFRELLGKKHPGSVVPVNLDIKGLRVELFNDLLKYLYSGELSGSYDPRSNSASYEALIRISQECGVPNPLSHDLKYLLETGIYSDASLCFQSPSDEVPTDNNSKSVKKCTCCEQSEFSCHQAILTARSPFFRNVILRQQRRNATLKQADSLNQRIKIVLDESIIPRRFARILLHVMYRDSENIINLLQSSVCKCQVPSSSQNSKDNHFVLVKEIMDLYEIARFLEIDFLVQSCEDLIIEFLTIETLIPILRWSEQSHGSPWVKRQALCFLKEEFSTIASTSSLLYQLEYSHLLEALKSDFLEASELEILKAVVKWGEHRLLKQMEEVEPNLLSSHSLTRKSFRKKEIDDSKLRELLSELISLVRIGHIIPIDSEYLTLTAKRGLIDTLPPFMVTDDNSLPINRGMTAWFRNRCNGNFVRPRYFTPYCEECKNTLEVRLGLNISTDDNFDSVSAILNKKCAIQIPDTLYMVDKSNFTNCGTSVVSDGDLLSPVDNLHFCFTSSSSSSVICYDEVDKPRPNLPILEERILLMMRQREQELKTSPLCVRALKISHNRCEALRLIQLRVVREFGLPDVASEVLHLRNFSNAISGAPRDRTGQFAKPVVSDIQIPPPPPRPSSGFMPPLPPSNSSQCDPFSYDSELKLESSSRYELESQVEFFVSYLPFETSFSFLVFKHRITSNSKRHDSRHCHGFTKQTLLKRFLCGIFPITISYQHYTTFDKSTPITTISSMRDDKIAKILS